MKWGKVEVTGGFFLLLAWLNYWDRQALLVPLALLACLCHELGHYRAILAFGGDVRRVRLTAVGAEMVLDGPLAYWQEGVAALAGPGVNLLLALVFCHWEWGRVFAGLNLVLACFNLMPVGRLDGGRTMYCTMALLIGEYPARRVGRWMDGLCIALLLGTGGMLARQNGNLTLLLIAVWLLSVFFGGKKGGIRTCHTGGKRLQ